VLKLLFKIFGLAILVAIFFARFYNLDADPPAYYTGHGQAQLTDPYHLTHFARNSMIFGDPNPFDYHRWDLFRYSMISGASCLIFSIFGVSRLTANFSGLLVQLMGVILFLWGLSRFWDKKIILLTATFLIFNSTLFFYGRLPFLENGLILFSGISFLLFAFYHLKTWGQILTGVFVSFAALAGKLFGLILIGPVLLTLIYIFRKDAIRPILSFVLGLLLGAGFFGVIFFRGQLGILRDYYAEQTVGMYGAPPGLTSLPGFVKMLLTYGGESGFLEYTPILIFLALLSLIILFFSTPFTGKFERNHIPVVFLTAWLIFGVLGLMPFKYRPLRYSLFLYLPLSAICAFVFGMILEKKLRLILRDRYITLPVIVIVSTYIIVQIKTFFAPFGTKFATGVDFIPAAFAVAICFGLLILFVFRGKKISYSGRFLLYPFIVLFAALIFMQSQYIFRGLFHSGKYLKQYSKELECMLDREAVITGPYGATFNIDNNMKNIIYMFGLSNVDSNLFEAYPITHVAADKSNWDRAVSDFPFLESSIRIVQMPVRDITVDIFRIPHAKLALTDFEKASTFLSRGKADSAYIYFKKFNEIHPDHFFGRTHLAYSAMITGSIEESLSLVERLLSERADDYVLYRFCKTFYYQLYQSTGDPKYLNLSKKYELRGRKSS
jgi:hypothetical protein